MKIQTSVNHNDFESEHSVKNQIVQPSVFFDTDQKRAEEDEGNKVEVRKVTSTLLPYSS